MNRPFIPEEIKKVLYDMNPCKAPGPDGFSEGFFQKTWEITGSTSIELGLNFFSNGELPQGCNDTIITLIPKVPIPENVKQLQPIGLCNVTYKLLTKTMVPRLKEISKKLV